MMARWNSFIQFLDEASQLTNDVSRQQLVNELLRERRNFPWVEGDLATFIYADPGAQRVAVNLDIIDRDPPFVEMVNLKGTSLWYVQRKFDPRDVLDYLIVVDDPMTPISKDPNLVNRINRFWRSDELNPQRIRSGQMQTSILQMSRARPFPDWERMQNVPRGQVNEHDFSSVAMGFTDRKLWVYTPPEYDDNPDKEYPLLILLDGQWMVGPLQVPFIADAMIKHNRMEPCVIAMKQSSGQASRLRDYVSNDNHYNAIVDELVPLLKSVYRINPTHLGIGGAGVGAVAAAHTALKNPDLFKSLLMLSPPLGKGQMQQQLVEYAERFDNAPKLPERIFQSVGRYELENRFYKPGLALAGILQRREHGRGDVDHRFIELYSGHGLAAFKSVLPEGFSHILPGAAFLG